MKIGPDVRRDGERGEGEIACSEAEDVAKGDAFDEDGNQPVEADDWDEVGVDEEEG